MMATFSILDVILILGVSQGIFLMYWLLFMVERNKSANRILVLLLGTAVLMLTGRILVYRFEVAWIWRLALFVDVVIFLFGPLFYCYVRRLAFKEAPLFSLSRWHFILALLHFFLFLSSFRFTIKEYFELYADGKLHLQFIIVEGCGLLSLAVYLGLSLRLILSYKKRVKENLSQESKVLPFLISFSSVLALLLIVWGASFLNMYLSWDYHSFFNYGVMWMLIPLVVYVIGYFSLRNPELFRMPIIKDEMVNDRLNQEEVNMLMKRLEFFMNEEKVYLDPELTLSSLSKKMDTSTNDLSWLLNNSCNTQFYDYINKRRIAAFLSEIEKGAHKNRTLLAVALDVGFNSKSTFNRCFRKYLGTTPSRHIKEIKVA